eukprot:COSAG04_NODE_534_length_12949_cov_5.651673_16_plen_124_part_00
MTEHAPGADPQNMILAANGVRVCGATSSSVKNTPCKRCFSLGCAPHTGGDVIQTVGFGPDGRPPCICGRSDHVISGHVISADPPCCTDNREPNIGEPDRAIDGHHCSEYEDHSCTLTDAGGQG